jgi:hypothetical protein
MIFTKFVKSRFTLKRPELHLDVSTAQGPKLHLNLPRLVCTTGACSAHGRFTPQGPELHLEVSTLQRPMLHLDMSTPQGPELHLNSIEHEPVLLLDVLYHRGLMLFPPSKVNR